MRVAISGLSSHHVGDPTDGLGVQHDDLGGHVSLHGLRHVLHRAVDGRVFDLEPVVCVPANQEPHVLLPVELLLEHLRQGGGRCDEPPRLRRSRLERVDTLTSQNTFLASVS